MAREKICGIYKIENLVNGKVYIGQSVDIYKRWTEHKCSCKNENGVEYNKILYKSFRKYGIDNFSFEILEECLEGELNEKEIYYISLYRSYVHWENSNGYNLTIGGDGTRGRMVTEEQLKLMSERMKGKLSKGLNPNACKVVCEGKEFDSIVECAEHYNESRYNMSNWVSGRTSMPKQWYKKGLRLFDKTMEDYTIRPESYVGENSPLPTCPIICEGKVFYSLKDFSNNYPQAKNVFNWLNGISSMPKEWEEKGLRYLDGHTDDIIIYQDEEYWKEVHKNRSESHKGYIPPNAFKVYCEGKEFVSVNKCAEYYGVNAGTMKGWINGSSAMPKEWYDKGLRREDKKMSDYKIQTQSKRVVCDGIVFESITECAEYYDVLSNSISDWLNKRANMPQKFYDMELHYEKDSFEECNYEIQSEHPYNIKAVICEEKEYANVDVCAKYYNINPRTMRNWLNHTNKMPKAFYDLGLHYKDEPMENYEISKKCKLVICEGIIFDSISSCAEHYGIKNFTLSKWLKGKNPMPQEFKDKGLKYYE